MTIELPTEMQTGPSQAPPPSTLSPDGLLMAVRRRWGLALLAAAALVFAPFVLFSWSSGFNGPWELSGYLFSLGWALWAVTAFLGAHWARRTGDAGRPDRIVLVVGGVALALTAVANTAEIWVQNFSWSASVYDGLQIVLTLADLTIAVLLLVLAARYRRYRARGSGHTPLLPLLMAGLSYLGFLYGDILGGTWFAFSPLNSTLASVGVAVGFGGIALALWLAAGLRLGPRWRLLTAGGAVLLLGAAETVILGVYLRQSVQDVLSVTEAVAYVVIAAVLLGSALLAPPWRGRAVAPGPQDGQPWIPVTPEPAGAVSPG